MASPATPPSTNGPAHRRSGAASPAGPPHADLAPPAPRRRRARWRQSCVGSTLVDPPSVGLRRRSATSPRAADCATFRPRPQRHWTEDGFGTPFGVALCFARATIADIFRVSPVSVFGGRAQTRCSPYNLVGTDGG